MSSYHLEAIFANMCGVVGANYLMIDRTKENWYLQHNWDIVTETRFRDWMADYIHKMLGAQQELYGRRYMKKHECIKAADMFLLNYGWKTK